MSSSFAASSSNTRMNSSPMIMRLRSGSSTPASRSRKRCSASTRIRFTPSSSIAVTTWSASFFRIRPWSTSTQVSWSPIARCTSAAAVAESTPPESPQSTPASPTSARMRSTCSSITDAGDQFAAQPAISVKKRSRICWPNGVWTTSG